ncbi:hypothetical protein UFOVP816_29 [uncultured Caudovirales phage]|uniref:Prokaryotic membrane lipoprotein lipid attachment site profile n=1 Tax=uncultured Caudovirales phage TaxID=2100421 RepID=A0A6J5P4V5_9CAUD|nr:hypothetical protein UFOVP816_29 [uncultured Caudovirales phage]
MRYLIVALLPLLAGCEKLPMLLKELSISQQFELDVHSQQNDQFSSPENMSGVRRTDEPSGDL